MSSLTAACASSPQILKVTKQSALRGTVTDSIFYHLMRQSDVGIAHDAIVNGEDLGDDEDEDDEVSSCQL